MEFIKIPQVSLVDASGKRIGVYTDDPDWWQQLKLKQHQFQLRQNEVRNGTGNPNPAIAAATPIDDELVTKQKTVSIFKQYVTKKPAVNGDDSQSQSMTSLQLKSFNKVKPCDDLISHENIPNQTDESRKHCNVIGETPLHIAIIYEDLTTIRFLIETKGFSPNQRCVGGKFQPGFTSKLTANAISNSEYEGLAYFGEYPLAFAACFCNKEIYDYLISQGADPNLQDSYGNTVLHILVINNKLNMFKYAINHPVKMADLTIRNFQNLTSLNLAAKLGRVDLFSEMLELRKVEYWRYHNIACSAYPLDGLDTIDDDGKIAWNSALNFIINGNTDDHLEMIEGGVVRRLLDDKWTTYAQRRFFQRLILATIHLIFLSIAVYCRQADYENLLVWPVTSATTWVRYISEIAVVFGCLSNLLLQIQEIYAQGFLYYLKNLKSEPAKVSFQLSCILILCAVPFRFVKFSEDSSVNSRYVEDLFVILAVPCSWIFLLFFARVANITGPFVVMIYKMIVGDILTFSYIYVIVLFGFSLSFYYLFKNGSENVHSFDRFENSILIAFQMTLGEFKDRVEEFDEVQYSDFIKVIFVVFMIMVHILLLNMLIAMMGNTYQQIIIKSEREWRRQWAHIVILLERTFSANELRKYQEEYSIKLPTKGKKGQDLLGLMVIKKTSKTKAYQKNNAVRNWKDLGRKVMMELKSKKCDAKELFKRPESPLISTVLSQAVREITLAKRILKSFSHDRNTHEMTEFGGTRKANTFFEAKRLSNDETATEATTSTTTTPGSTNQSPPINASLIKQIHQKAFVPNQQNKIYPMMSTSLTEIEKLSNDESEKNSTTLTVFDTEDKAAAITVAAAAEDSKQSKHKFSLSSAYKDGLSYIKRETYPKFTNNRIINFINNKHRDGSSNSSNSELLKERTSSDGDYYPTGNNNESKS